jgi:hypothetical protein
MSLSSVIGFILIGFVFVLFIGMPIKQFFIDYFSMCKVSPHKRYFESVSRYYAGYVNNVYPNNDIQLPSPYQSEYNKNKDIWNDSGYWQNQWKHYVNKMPSIYTGDFPLPEPYVAPHSKPFKPYVWFIDECKNERAVII